MPCNGKWREAIGCASGTLSGKSPEELVREARDQSDPFIWIDEECPEIDHEKLMEAMGRMSTKGIVEFKTTYDGREVRR